MLVIALCVILPVTSINNNISSVGRAINCRAGGRGFDSQGRTNTQGFFFSKNLEIRVVPLLCKRLDLHVDRMTT